MASDLVNIPPEVQGLVGDYLPVGDLNSVSRTCKTLNSAFLAKLYRCVIIKVPIQWSRLGSLENLISSAGNGLKFTNNFCITARKQPLKDDTRGYADGPIAQELADERDDMSCLPRKSASVALNVMIRLLLKRIADNKIKSFDWRHSCTLETSTILLLLKHQGDTLRGLGVTRYSEPQNLRSILVGGLQHLVITDLNIEQGCEWPARLIVQSLDTIQHLHLGVLSTIAQEYVHGRLSQHDLPGSFAEMTKKALPASARENKRMLSLETLGLYGLNFENVIGEALGFEIDFASMTSLRLESCSGLYEAFGFFMGYYVQSARLCSFKLKTFFVRHEAGGPGFAQLLTDFLTSFTGLEHLGLLLEGQSNAMSKAPILEMHGKTLKTLVWDERTKARKDTKKDTSSKRLKDNNLGLISLKCPNLRALGLALGWRTSSTAASLKMFEKSFRRMPKLGTLHFRNLPEMDLTACVLLTDYMIKGIASAVLDMYAGGKPSNHPKPLTTIALGAPLYGDIHIGSKHFPNDPVHDVLQLRVYHVDYKYRSVLGPSPTVTQVAKGTADDVITCSDKGILNEYWLA